MRFIDLYNKNKNLPVFKEKVKIFKTYCYLAKKNPDKYKVVFLCGWGKRYFSYLEKTGSETGEAWLELQNSNDKWKEMGDFKERNY